MMAGQTINDRLLAARHSIAGQGLAKSVCKATTEEMIGPKKKHLDYLVQCTNEPNVSIPQLANLLIERSQNTNWIVVYKALITVHHMMCYGNERFTQYLASSNSTFQLNNFLDKSGLQGYDMSAFIRRYARYLNEKALSYRTVAFDFCKVKRGKEDGTLRTMNAERLLKTLPTLHQQLVALLLFDCEANNLTNGVINMSFMLLFRDLIRLFACYNDGVINLLEKYFDMNKKQCKEALDLYKEFLQGMDNVAEFLKVAENVGIDKGEIPDLTKAPSSLLGALEQHLASLDGKKSNTSTPTQSATNERNIKFGVSALSTTSSAFGAAVTNGTNSASNGINESLKQQILAEEEAAMNQYKSKLQSPNSATNPFLSSPMLNNNPQPQVDLFAPAPSAVKHDPFNRASEDLLQLNNPFADVFGAPQAPVVANSMWITNGNGLGPQTATPFVTESNFNSVFGTTESTAAIDNTKVKEVALLNPFLDDFPSDVPQTPDPNPPQLFYTLDHPTDDVSSYFPEPVISQDSIFKNSYFNVEATSTISSETDATQSFDELETIRDNQQIQLGCESTFNNFDNNTEPICDTIASEVDEVFDNSSNIFNNFSTETFGSASQQDSYIEQEFVVEQESVVIEQEPVVIEQESFVIEQEYFVIEQESVVEQESVIQNAIVERDLIFNTDVEQSSENIVPAPFGEGLSNKPGPPPRPPPPSKKPIPIPDEPLMMQPIPEIAPFCPPQPISLMSLMSNIPNTSQNTSMSVAAPQIFKTPEQGFDGLGSVLQPAGSASNQNNQTLANNMKNNQQSQLGGSAFLTGDLESSLASLAENLSINKGPPPVKSVQWNSPKNGAKPGASWTPQPMAATTGAGYRPMGHGMTSIPPQPMFTQIQPMGMRPIVAGQGMMTPMVIGAAAPGAQPTMAQQQSLLFH